MGKSLALTLVFLLLATFAGNAAAEVQYTLTDLGTLGGLNSFAFAINNHGQIVGESQTTITGYVGDYHAFLHNGSGPLNRATDDLGTFGYGGIGTGAKAINDSGQVVGFAAIGTGNDPPTRAFLHSGRSPLNRATDDLGTLGGTSSGAYGINDIGQVVGWANTSPAQHAFLRSGSGPLTDLGTFGGTFSCAFGINNVGQIVGYADTASGAYHAFMHTGAGYLDSRTDDLGTLGGTFSTAVAINDSGWVVGVSDVNMFTSHAFLHFGSGTLNPATDDLGTLGGNASGANDINNNGQVVGSSDTTAYGYPHAFIYYGSGPIQDLNALIPPNSGLTLTTANGINDLGQIVGCGITVDGYGHAFLLTPVPEPSTLALLAAAVSALLVYGLRQERKRGEGIFCFKKGKRGHL